MDAFVPHEKLGSTLRADIEAQDQIGRIWSHYNLQGAYSFAEVMETIQEVCKAYTSVPPQMVIAAIRYGRDPVLVREFFATLVKISQGYVDRK